MPIGIPRIRKIKNEIKRIALIIFLLPSSFAFTKWYNQILDHVERHAGGSDRYEGPENPFGQFSTKVLFPLANWVRILVQP